MVGEGLGVVDELAVWENDLYGQMEVAGGGLWSDWGQL